MSEITKMARNTFRDGLVMDLAPDNTLNTCLTSALNATLITLNGNEFSLQNDYGNGRVETAFLPEGYIPVGTCEFGDIVYIVSYNPLTNKSQIGCFPSPERNISSEEIENLSDATLSAGDFQVLDADGKPTGELKATSVRKIVYDKDLRPGDKYIIYDTEGSILTENYISDIGNTEHIFGHLDFKKYVTIHVVSIEDSGKINYLDSTVKWYSREDSQDYFINISKTETESDKPDIDSYRNLLSSGYSVFSSKVSGKLALLIELEKISGFDCTYSVYEESENKYAIYLYMNWESDNDKIYPKYAVLTSDNGNDLIIDKPSVYPNQNYWKEDITDAESTNLPDSIEQYYINDTGLPRPGFYNNRISISDVIVNNKYKQSFCKRFNYSEGYGYDVTSIDTEIYNNDNNSNLIYEFEITPAMEYGLLKEYSVKNTIDFSKINKKVAEITTYKYYVTDSEVIMKLGINAYKPSYYDVKNITLDYYDNRGLIATLTIDNRVSYSGTFTLHIPISSSYTLSESVFKYNDKGNKDIFPNYLYGVVISVNYKKKNSDKIEPIQFTRWMWTSKVLNSEFNKSTLDFGNITIELPLDLGSEFTYTESENQPSVDNDTSKTTGYHYTVEAKKLNLSHNLIYGLQNNWEGTFKLANADDCELSIGIGDRKVSNDEYKIITSTNTHTGYSNIIPVNSDLGAVIDGAVSELKNGFTVKCINTNDTGETHDYLNSYGEVSSVELYTGGDVYTNSENTAVGKTANYEVTLYNYSKYHTIVDSSLLNTVNIYKRWIDINSDLFTESLKTVDIDDNSDLYENLFTTLKTISVNPNSVENGVLIFKDFLQNSDIKNGFFQIKLTPPQNNIIKFGLNNNLNSEMVSYNTAFSTYYTNIQNQSESNDGPYFWAYKNTDDPKYTHYFFSAKYENSLLVFSDLNYKQIFNKASNFTNLYQASRTTIILNLVRQYGYTLNDSIREDSIDSLVEGEYCYIYNNSTYTVYFNDDTLTKDSNLIIDLRLAFSEDGKLKKYNDNIKYIELKWDAEPPFWSDEDLSSDIVGDRTYDKFTNKVYDLYTENLGGNLGTFEIPAYIKSTIYKYNHKDSVLDTPLIIESLQPFYILCYKYDKHIIMFNQFSKSSFNFNQIKTALNNLYVYDRKDIRSLDIIESVAFLNPYKTYYTLDLVYKLSPKDNSQVCCLSATDYNNVSWVTIENAVQKFMDDTVTGPSSGLSWPDLNIKLKSCVKNIPVQFQLEYKQPNIVTQQQVSTGVCIEKENGEEISCLLNDDESKKLWYFDSNKLVLLSLDPRYYYLEDETLKANPYLYKAFLDYENNLLIPVLHYDDGSESDYIGILNHQTSLEKKDGWNCVLEADPEATDGSAVFKWYKKPNYIKDIYRYYVVLPDYKVLINDEY